MQPLSLFSWKYTLTFLGTFGADENKTAVYIFDFWCMMKIIVYKVLFAPIIITVAFKTNIPLQHTLKSRRNEFKNYLISLLEFYLEWIAKLVCEKREYYEEEKIVFWKVVLNNKWFDPSYRQSINTSLESKYLIPILYN